MSEELKPCPFCGAPVHRVEREFQHNGCTGYEDIIRCSSCALVCEDMHGDAWNTRHTPEGYALVPFEPLLGVLNGAICPCCDGSGGYYDNYGDVCQCQWCHEKAMIAAATETK